MAASSSAPSPDLSLERHRWKIIAIAVVILAIGARYEPTQALEAEVVGLGFPILAVLVGLAPLRDTRVTLRRWAGIAALLVLVGCEVELGRAFFPPDAVAEATLSDKQPDAVLTLPDGTRELDVETHGNLGSGHRSAEETFRYVLERDGKKEVVEGSFTKSRAIRLSRRRAPTSTSSHVVDLDRQSLSLSGIGPVHAHLESLQGSGARRVDIRLLPAPAWSHWFGWAVWAALAVAFGAQLAAARDGTRSKLAAWLAAAAVLGSYLPRHFSPSDPLGALIGAAFVSLLAGGIGGWLLGALAARVIGREAEA